MNNEIKVSLSLILPGNIMYSQEQAEALEKVKSASGFDMFSMTVENPDGGEKETLRVKTRKSIPASQSINLTKEAYDSMVSKECPHWANQRDWSARNSKMRLEAHLQKICDSLGGTSYNYQVFED